jgi:hypothetical protein
MFHVKHFGPRLLPNAKSRENLAQNILDIHYAG